MAVHFDQVEFDRRLDRLCEKMRERKIDCMLLFAQESMYWLTGYDTFGYCFFQCMVVREDRAITLLTRSADLRQAELTSIVSDIRVWADRAGANPALDLHSLLDDLGLLGSRFGVEYDTHGLTALNGRRLDDALRTFGTIEDASDIVSDLRTVKSPAEIAFVKKAAELGDLAFEAALSETRPGADEAKILAAMHNAIFEGGGDYPGNEFIIGSGPEALLCRYQSGRRILEGQDQLTLEWAGVFRHYHCAYMQTIPVGRATPRHEELYEAAHKALLACREAMTVGATFGDVFQAHARVMEDAGLANHRLNACGYSLGARFSPSWMDAPMFYRDNPAIIEPDMVLFAHMIIMDSDTETAMTLGRTYLTSDEGPQDLSKLPLELVVR
ncbi:MAG: Xaa-Pro peptidase family protein [Pseudomonadota bacterium]